MSSNILNISTNAEKPRSIALHAHQIAAIKAGKAAQQRMIVLSDNEIELGYSWTGDAVQKGAIFDRPIIDKAIKLETVVDCPYGDDGDILWVTEVHRPIAWRFDDGEVLIEYRDGTTAWLNYLTDEQVESGSGTDEYLFEILKELDARNVPKLKNKNGEWVYDLSDPDNLPYWRSPDEMPEFASRLSVKVAGIYIENVQSCGLPTDGAITLSDPLNKWAVLGINTKKTNKTINYPDYPLNTKFFRTLLDEFMVYWDLVHGIGAWDRNDWVWVCEINGVDHG